MTTETLVLDCRTEIQHLRSSTTYGLMTYWKGSCEKHIHLCFMFQMFNGEQYKALNKELADAVREWQNVRYVNNELKDVV